MDGLIRAFLLHRINLSDRQAQVRTETASGRSWLFSTGDPETQSGVAAAAQARLIVQAAGLTRLPRMEVVQVTGPEASD